jgi:hypothetical protein
MYVRIYRTVIQPWALPEIARLYERTILPDIQRLPGFYAFFLLFHEQYRMVASVSMWDPETHPSDAEVSRAFMTIEDQWVVGGGLTQTRGLPALYRLTPMQAGAPQHYAIEDAAGLPRVTLAVRPGTAQITPAAGAEKEALPAGEYRILLEG